MFSAAEEHEVMMMKMVMVTPNVSEPLVRAWKWLRTYSVLAVVL